MSIVWRTLIVDLSKSFGGADKRVAQLATGLGAEFDVTVMVIAGSQTHHQLERSGAKLWPVNRSRKDPRLIFDVVKCLKKLKPHVVDAHNSQSILWGLTAAFFCSTSTRIATIHSIYEESEQRRFGRYLFGGLYHLAANTATHVVAVSEVVASHMEKRGVSSNNVIIIENGVDVERRSSPRQPQERRLRIACVGRLVPVKAQSILLHAIAQLRTSHNRVECWLIGDGPERQRLEALSHELGLDESVTFWGMRSDVSDLVKQCDVFCLSSLTEGLPFAALEAAALAVPIIATRVGGIPRHFTHNKTALLVPPSDPAALASTLEYLANNPLVAAQIGWNAWKMVNDTYSLGVTLEQTRQLYKSIAVVSVPESEKLHI